MEITRLSAFDRLPNTLRGGVVAIGNFDGVHLGHQAVLAQAINAETLGPRIALTFEPHPRQFFQPDVLLPRITPADQKAHLLAAMGFDAVVEQPFTKDFSTLTAEEFVTDILIKGFGSKHVVTGFDFHFGTKRSGGPAFMLDAGKRHVFEVTLVDAFRDDQAEVISSSRIRNALLSGNLDMANCLLGYRHRVTAEISAGKQLGRTLGYPTANMALPEGTPLAHGIYAVRFHRADGSVHDGVASFGRRPTVDEDGAPLLETFVFDFDGDLYGELCTVSFVAYLRGEEKFDGLDALVAQMDRDSQNARQILALLQPLSSLDNKLTFSGDA
ncbi:MAG: bifunctional riboflavin kinase/FAD synthetase [Pseudomonadota bacterium]